MGAGSTVTERLHRFVKPVREGEARQGELPSARFLQRNSHVFDEMFDEESGIEITGKNLRRQVVECPAGGGPAANGIQHAI